MPLLTPRLAQDLKNYQDVMKKLTKNGESRTYYRITPGESGYSIKDIKNYIKYKGEHYA